MKKILIVVATVGLFGCGQSKKEAMEIICESHEKSYSDEYLMEHIKNPEMSVYLAEIVATKTTPDAMLDQLRSHAKDVGVECALVKTLEVNAP